ncbi:MAG: 4Fe-4S ferredoxin [Lentisphaerae bacterium]|nr:4Fe-4S ferredoxin [Lentisphaerota bacterium]
MSKCGCPGSMTIDRRDEGSVQASTTEKVASQLRQWPIQLHLIGPNAPYYQGADVVLTADCVAYAMGGYHSEHLKGKAIAIACPKLDEGQDIYEKKITAWFDEAKINTLTVMIMEVPCCGGLSAIAQRALAAAERKVPVKVIVVGLDGEIRQEQWLTA